MKASFDKEELMAGLAELEKRVREHRPHGRPAAAPDSRLDLDLTAIEAAVKSRNAPKLETVENAGLSVDAGRDQSAQKQSVTLDVVPDRELRAYPAGKGDAPGVKALEVGAPDRSRERTAPSRSAAIDVFAEKELRAPISGRMSAPPVADAAPLAGAPRQQAPASRSENIDPVPEKSFHAAAARTESAPSRPHRWIYAAAAIFIVIGSLLGGAGYFASGKISAALRSSSPSASQKLDPAPAAAAESPAPEATADVGPATPAAAQETAVAGLRGGEGSPPPEPATQAAQETALAAPVGAAAASAIAAPAAAAAVPPEAAKAASVAEPPATAAAPGSEAPVAKPAKLGKKPKKPAADKSEDKSARDAKAKRQAKEKPEKVAKPHPAAEASAPPAAPAQPHALAEPPPSPPAAAQNPEPGVLGRAGQAVGSITGTVKGWVGLDSGARQ